MNEIDALRASVNRARIVIHYIEHMAIKGRVKRQDVLDVVTAWRKLEKAQDQVALSHPRTDQSP